ncbi:MAG TPA: hypothetical protein VNV35_13015 [Puia sp.]|nr:hypothetical protein [Puia sp.]
MDTDEYRWKMRDKFNFRFFFLFLGSTSVFCWIMNIYFVYRAVANTSVEDLYPIFRPLSGIFLWLDIHIYHTGYDPALHVALPIDNHFGVIYYFTLFFLSVIAAVIWSVLDKGRIDYGRFSYWFNVYLRYTLAITILGYGIDKMIPVQMPYPRTVDMVRLFGNQSKEDLLWKFIGISPAYSFFTGGCEMLAAILLFSRRTAVFGYLFVLGVLTNVVALNWFYNISVKLYSSLLWVYAFYLLAPWLKNIFRFFFSAKPATLPIRHFTFFKKRKRYSLQAVMILLPLLFFLAISMDDISKYRNEVASARREKMYKVTTFTVSDTVPAADSIRWRRVLFVYDNLMLIYNMNDLQDWYRCDVDSPNKTLTLHALYKPDVMTLRYTYPSDGELRLSGKWKAAKDIDVLLKLSPADSMYLNKERIKIIRD